MVLCVGKLKEKYWTDAVCEYAKRLSPYCTLKMCIRDSLYRCRREKGVVYADYVPVLGKEIHKTDDEHYGGVLYVDYKVVRYLRHNVS